MSAHTPGPWTVGVFHDEDQPDLITADDGTKYHRRRHVARVCTSDAYRDMSNATAKADAALIAAAPDLLAALERTTEMLRAVSEYLLDGNPFLGQPDGTKFETEGVRGNTAAARRVAELIGPNAVTIAKARGADPLVSQMNELTAALKGGST